MPITDGVNLKLVSSCLFFDIKFINQKLNRFLKCENLSDSEKLS